MSQHYCIFDRFNTYLSTYELAVTENRKLIENVQFGSNSFSDLFNALDRVYHSESMHEMQVNADLQGVDLCNPYVLMFLARETTYHHAFWPHTAKRFLAFKNILRKNKDVRKSFKDGNLLAMLNIRLLVLNNSNHHSSLCDTPGQRQELKNIKEVISIVEKAMNEA